MSAPGAVETDIEHLAAMMLNFTAGAAFSPELGELIRHKARLVS